MAVWMIGAPRLDKIIAPRDLGDNAIEVTVIDDDVEGKHPAMPKEQAVSLFATFWDRVLTEFNVAKAMRGTADSPELCTLVRLLRRYYDDHSAS